MAREFYNKTDEQEDNDVIITDYGTDDDNDNIDEYYRPTNRTAVKRKNKNPILRFAGAVIPMGGDGAGEIIRKLILILSLGVAVFCGILLINSANKEARQVINDNGRAEIKQEIEASGIIPLNTDKIEEIKKEAPGILDKYMPFYDQNPDIVGWVKVNDTPIDYPVMQSEDNDFYLYRDFDKNDSQLGSIFADYHVPFVPEGRPNNTVLYGHNISNGSYFAKLTNYYPARYGSLDFYLSNPTVAFDTIYEEGTYKVFAGVFINTEERHGSVYEYYKKRTFKDKEAFYDFSQNILDRSVFYTDVDLEYGDEILTLSTCYYPLGNDVDTRFVVFARRVREGESPDVDISSAYINPSPLYFDYYYLINGGAWAGRNWDTSKVTGLDEYLADNPSANTASAVN